MGCISVNCPLASLGSHCLNIVRMQEASLSLLPLILFLWCMPLINQGSFQIACAEFGPECQYNTFNQEYGQCLMFSNCIEVSELNCQNCVSNDAACLLQNSTTTTTTTTRPTGPTTPPPKSKLTSFLQKYTLLA